MNNDILLSICIPTFNRPELLLFSLKSIIKFNTINIEICISNNASSSDYSEVLDYISQYNFIKYINSDYPLSIDENMHRVISLAQGKYIYLLGDDDYFLDNSIEIIKHHLIQNEPDLMIINGINSKNNKNVGRLFTNSPPKLIGFEESYLTHHNHCMFGAIAIKSSLINNKFFTRFYGTCHAYMSFWVMLSISKNPVITITPNEPLVVLRQNEKTYNLYFIEALYEMMPKWFSVFISTIHNEKHINLIKSIQKNNNDFIYSIRQISICKLLGYNVLGILRFNNPLPLKTYLKVAIVYLSPKISLKFFGYIYKTICHLS